MQNRGMRVILGCNKLTPIALMLDALKWLPVASRLFYMTMDIHLQDGPQLVKQKLVKIGYHSKSIKMALQAAERPVRYGISSEWDRIPNYRSLPIYPEDNLPKDPRQWTRENVAHWLRHVTTAHNLPEVPPSRFLMNGKALCLMTPSMFLSRVPLGGKLLYKDFQLRLCTALYSRS